MASQCEASWEAALEAFQRWGGGQAPAQTEAGPAWQSGVGHEGSRHNGGQRQGRGLNAGL